MAEQVVYPFRVGTRQRRKNVVPASALTGLGATASYILPRVGLMNYLILELNAVVTTGATTFATLGPWSLLKRVKVSLNLGNMTLVDLSGWSLYQLNKLLFRSWAPDGGGVFTPAADTFLAATAAAGNPWKLILVIPISANPGSEFDTGLINLQAPEVQVNVDVELATAGTDFVASGFTSLTAVTAKLDMCYFDLPLPGAPIALPMGQIVRSVEQEVPINAVGELDYTIQRQGQIMQLCSTFLLNGARSNLLDRTKLIANINDTIYDEASSTNRFINQMDLSSVADVGVYTLDLWHAREAASSGDGRDLINSEVLTTLQWNPVVSSGAVLGSNNNVWKTARRILVNFAMPGLGPSI